MRTLGPAGAGGGDGSHRGVHPRGPEQAPDRQGGARVRVRRVEQFAVYFRVLRAGRGALHSVFRRSCCIQCVESEKWGYGKVSEYPRDIRDMNIDLRLWAPATSPRSVKGRSLDLPPQPRVVDDPVAEAWGRCSPSA